MLLFFVLSMTVATRGVDQVHNRPTTLENPPANFERDQGATSYDWCECGTELWTVNGLRIKANNATFLLFDSPVTQVSWLCRNGSAAHHKSLPFASVLISLKITFEKKPWPCGKMSARLRWNTWKPSNQTVYRTTSTPFTSLQRGYACVKIPVLLRTENGTLLVFAEARKENW